MKKTLLKIFPLPVRKTLFSMIVLATITFSLQTTLASASMVINDTTIVVNKTQGTKKHKIRLYPNATNEVLFFTVSGEEDKIYQLFIFDLESKLIKQTMVRNRQTSFITKFTKGEYTYEVFCNDHRIENGSVVIK